MPPCNACVVRSTAEALFLFRFMSALHSLHGAPLEKQRSTAKPLLLYMCGPHAPGRAAVTVTSLRLCCTCRTESLPLAATVLNTGIPRKVALYTVALSVNGAYPQLTLWHEPWSCAICVQLVTNCSVWATFCVQPTDGGDADCSVCRRWHTAPLFNRPW